MHCPRKKRPTRDFSAIAVPSMHGSGCLDYTIGSHSSKALQAMEEFRQQEMLCDLVLHVTYKERTVDFKVSHVQNAMQFIPFGSVSVKIPNLLQFRLNTS